MIPIAGDLSLFFKTVDIAVHQTTRVENLLSTYTEHLSKKKILQVRLFNCKSGEYLNPRFAGEKLSAKTYGSSLISQLQYGRTLEAFLKFLHLRNAENGDINYRFYSIHDQIL